MYLVLSIYDAIIIGRNNIKTSGKVTHCRVNMQTPSNGKVF